MGYVAAVIDWIFRLFILVVLVDVILSYFLSPYHPVRQALDRIVQPLLVPIRRILPQTGTIDFSPMVLLIVLWLLNSIVQGILR